MVTFAPLITAHDDKHFTLTDTIISHQVTEEEINEHEHLQSLLDPLEDGQVDENLMNNDIILNNSNQEEIENNNDIDYEKELNNLSIEVNENENNREIQTPNEFDLDSPGELESLGDGDNSSLLSLGDSSIGSMNSKSYIHNNTMPTFQVNIEFPKETMADNTFNLTSVKENENIQQNEKDSCNYSRSSVSLTTEFSAYSSLDGNKIYYIYFLFIL
jgi:hypothetical protein